MKAKICVNVPRDAPRGKSINSQYKPEITIEKGSQWNKNNR